jgi:hypothetical protein
MCLSYLIIIHSSCSQVRHVSLQMHIDLKSAILNLIHLWGVLLSAEERMTMSAGEVKNFVATCVTELCSIRDYTHHGKDSEVCWPDISIHIQY